MESNTTQRWHDVTNDQQKFPVSALSDLTGLPLSLLKAEMLLDKNCQEDTEISLGEFRSAVLSYLDKTLDS